MVAIKRNSPIRKAVAEKSDYYDNKAEAIKALDAVLAPFGFGTDSAELPGNAGSTLLAVVDVEEAGFGMADTNAFINCSWYRMESGRYEFTFYVT